MDQYPNVLRPDGVDILVPWADFQAGESIFIPCIKVDKARSQVMRIGERQKMILHAVTRIERGMLGLRVWRIA